MRSACPPAQRAATQMAVTKAATQTGAPEAATQVAAPMAAMWAVALVTGTRAVARGAAMRVEPARQSRTLGVRELVGDPSSASGYVIADGSLAMGSN